MNQIIEACKLSFSYDHHTILNQVSFSISEGDFVGIIGPNGAGKSTVLKLVLGELTPEAGELKLLGASVQDFKKWSQIGYVSQKGISTGDSFPATCEEVVQAHLFSEIGMFHFPRKKHRQQALEALKLVNMEAYAKQLIGHLSGGQQQRVMIARVLVCRPKIILLDEPTTGIDSEAVDALYCLLKRLNHEEGITVAMVTHDVARASQYVSRVLCLDEGTITELHYPRKKEKTHDDFSI
jgi:zinc transport system ATP-binding protein